MIRLNTCVTTVSLYFTLFRDLFKTCKGNDRIVRQSSNTVCGKKKSEDVFSDVESYRLYK